MALSRALAVLCALSALLLACGDDVPEDNTPPIDELDTPDDRTDAGVDDETPEDLGSAEGACGWLTPDEIGDATGHQVVEATPEADGCDWQITDEAAVVDGPNEGEDTRLRLTTIDEETFRSARTEGEALEAQPVPDVGDEAYARRQPDDFTTTLYVADDGSFFALSIVAALDDPNATLDALVDLSRKVAARN